MNGKLGNAFRPATAAAAAAAADVGNALLGPLIDDLDSERGVKSSAPCDISDGAGDNGCGVRGLGLRFSSMLSAWLVADGARDRFSIDLW